MKLFITKILIVVAAAVVWLALYYFFGWIRKFGESYGSIEDDFFARMSPIDLYVRGVGDGDEYKKRYFSNIRDIDWAEIVKLTYDADKRLDAMGLKLIKQIPWKIKELAGGLENRFPHTIDDTIYIPTDWNIDGEAKTEILIHEKIHIFQRMYPELTGKLIGDWGFGVSSIGGRHPLQRNNPDLPDVNYSLLLDGRDEIVLVQLYHSKQPSSLSDSSPYAISADRNKRTVTKLKLLYAILDLILLQCITCYHSIPQMKLLLIGMNQSHLRQLPLHA